MGKGINFESSSNVKNHPLYSTDWYRQKESIKNESKIWQPKFNKSKQPLNLNNGKHYFWTSKNLKTKPNQLKFKFDVNKIEYLNICCIKT